MKFLFRKTIVSFLVLGIVSASAIFAMRKTPRYSSDHSVRPESQVESTMVQAKLTGESETATTKLIAAANSEAPDATSSNSTEPARTGVPSNTESTLDWSRFRGPNGMGVSRDTAIPTEWSDTQNLRWKTRLPGSGSSSPVLTDLYVFLTSYTGYGEEGSKGQVGQLKRQIHCIDRMDGKLVWSRTIDAVQPEDAYQGKGLPEHGYATNSMATDGKSIFAFLGKSGVFAFDMAGNEMWKVSVGTQSGNRGWGTAASLILYKDILIVNAAEESQTIFGINKNTGEVAWKAPGSTLELAYGTPIIARVNDDRDDLVIAVPSEVWGLNPSTGKLVWFVETKLTGNLSPSVVPDGDTVYVFGGFNSSGSLAIKLGGKGDVTKSNTLWTSRNSSYVVTPVVHEENLYWINDKGIYTCMSTKTGELLDKQRVFGIDSGGNPVYASPVAINGKLYMQTRTSGLFVLDGTPKMNVLKQNRFASDNSVFNATPAVSNGQLFLRSNHYLYCVMAESTK